MPQSIECIAKTQCIVGEGPHWDAKRNELYWVDMLGNSFYSLHLPSKKLQQWQAPCNVAAIFPTNDNDMLEILLQDGLMMFNKKSQEFKPLTRPNIHADSVFNDAKKDSLGRIWAVTKARNHRDVVSGLYCIDTNYECSLVKDNLILGNGIGFSPDDSKIYFSDSMRKEIYVCDFDLEQKTVGELTVFATIPADKGVPDGLCIDKEGNLWGTHWDGWCISCYTPDGKIKKILETPIQKPTSCCIGGANMDTLLFTSAAYDLSEDELKAQPHAGGVFSIVI